MLVAVWFIRNSHGKSSAQKELLYIFSAIISNLYAVCTRVPMLDGWWCIWLSECFQHELSICFILFSTLNATNDFCTPLKIHNNCDICFGSGFEPSMQASGILLPPFFQSYFSAIVTIDFIPLCLNATYSLRYTHCLSLIKVLRTSIVCLHFYICSVFFTFVFFLFWYPESIVRTNKTQLFFFFFAVPKRQSESAIENMFDELTAIRRR